MTRCPRCGTSMIWSSGDTTEGYVELWHCLGCGRETLADTDEQRLDDRLKEQAVLAVAPRYQRVR
jgi:transposase-like protein